MATAFSITVSTSSGAPIYRQIVNQVRARIAGGHMKPDEFLPSVRQLAEHLQINPMTVSKAYSLLEREGIIEFVRGQGMRVNPPGPAANGKARRAALQPLLKQVAATARQLSLSPAQVISELKPILENDDEHL
jgi:GntR family transcriptional regulator